MGLRRARRALHLLVRRAGLPERDVALDGVLEEEGLLRDDAHQLAQRRDREAADVVSVERDSPRAHVVEAGQEIGERGLARSGRAHQRDRLARGHRQADVGERVDARARIPEGYVIEHDAVVEPGDRDGV